MLITFSIPKLENAEKIAVFMANSLTKHPNNANAKQIKYLILFKENAY